MALGSEITRGEVVLVELNPTRGSEIRTTRPCVIVSPNELNTHMRTYLVAPMTTGGYPYPFRVPCRFQGTSGHVVVDQIRAIDQKRIVKRLGRMSPPTLARVLDVLQKMFTP